MDTLIEMKNIYKFFGGLCALNNVSLKIDKGEVNSQMLSDAINKHNVPSKNLHSFEEIVHHLKSVAKPGDTVITMGAGDVYKIGEMFLEK